MARPGLEPDDVNAESTEDLRESAKTGGAISDANGGEIGAPGDAAERFAECFKRWDDDTRARVVGLLDRYTELDAASRAAIVEALRGVDADLRAEVDPRDDGVG